MIENHVHIRSTDHFKQVGVREKTDRNEINSVDDHCVWFCIRVTFSSSIGKVFGLPAAWFVHKVLLAVFLFFIGCGSFLAWALPVMSQARKTANKTLNSMGTNQPAAKKYESSQIWTYTRNAWKYNTATGEPPSGREQRLSGASRLQTTINFLMHLSYEIDHFHGL